MSFLKKSLTAIAASLLICGHAAAIDWAVISDLHKNVQATLGATLGDVGNLSWRFDAPVSSIRQGNNAYQPGALLRLVGSTIQVTTGEGVYVVALVGTPYVELGRNFTHPDANVNPFLQYLRWSENALDVNVSKNGVTICSACTAISGEYSGAGSGNFLLVRDKTSGRYLSYGYQGKIQ